MSNSTEQARRRESTVFPRCAPIALPFKLFPVEIGLFFKLKVFFFLLSTFFTVSWWNVVVSCRIRNRRLIWKDYRKNTSVWRSKLTNWLTIPVMYSGWFPKEYKLSSPLLRNRFRRKNVIKSVCFLCGDRNIKSQISRKRGRRLILHFHVKQPSRTGGRKQRRKTKQKPGIPVWKVTVPKTFRAHLPSRGSFVFSIWNAFVSDRKLSTTNRTRP